MKKILASVLALTMLFMTLTGCGAPQEPEQPAQPEQTEQPAQPEAPEAPEEPETPAEPDPAPAQPVDVTVTALKGPTAMGMVSFMNEADSGALTDNNYHFSIASAPDEVGPLLIQGKTDIAAVPANLASVLYNNSKGAVQVLAINTLGVLYIVESGETVTSVADLAGKTIYASGKGNTPEYVLNYILQNNGIDPAKDVTIEWKSEHAECLAALTQQENAIAMLPQPFVTVAQTKNESIRVALDMTAEWDRLQGDDAASTLITGVVVGRREFIEQNPDAVDAFMTHYAESVAFVNENNDAAAELVGKYEIVPAPVAKKALPACNIVFIEGAEMQNKLSGYLSILAEANPKSVGGALPEADFYYSH